MTPERLKQIAYYLLLFITIGSCSNSPQTKNPSNSNTQKSLQLHPQKNDTTYFELEKNILISKKAPLNIQPHDTNMHSISEWKLTKTDSLYLFELIDIRYTISNSIITFLFDTKQDSVELTHQLPGEITFGEEAQAKQHKALVHLKRMKGFQFSIIKDDSTYFNPPVKFPLKEIAVDNEYNPALEIQNHLNTDDLHSIFDKMLLRPGHPFMIDSLYKDSNGSFSAEKSGNITLNYTFNNPKGYICLKNTFNTDHILTNSIYSKKSSTSKVLKTRFGSKGTIITSRKIDAIIQFKPKP